MPIHVTIFWQLIAWFLYPFSILQLLMSRHHKQIVVMKLAYTDLKEWLVIFNTIPNKVALTNRPMLILTLTLWWWYHLLFISSIVIWEGWFMSPRNFVSTNSFTRFWFFICISTSKLHLVTYSISRILKCQWCSCLTSHFWHHFFCMIFQVCCLSCDLFCCSMYGIVPRHDLIIIRWK